MRGDGRGGAAGAAAYLLWGVFPLYFHLLAGAGALETVAHRIVWTLVFCLVAVTILGRWTSVRAVFADRRLTVRLLIAGVLVSVNWLIYVYAVMADQVVDAALGYFINPLVTVMIALVVVRERLRPGQVVALLIGLVAVVVIWTGYGRVPWVGLGLALTFGLYSYVKHSVAARVTPTVGLGVEALGVAPFALGYIVWATIAGQSHFGVGGVSLTVLLITTGVVTAIPLVLFAAAAARLSLSSVALLQYITPIMQFSVGVWVFGEHMPVARWVGFGLIWCALIVLTVDLVYHARNHRPPLVQ